MKEGRQGKGNMEAGKQGEREAIMYKYVDKVE